MRLWLTHQLGDPIDVMRLEDGPAPTADADQVVLDIEAVGINFPDVLQCQGRYQVKLKLPFTVGSEIVGRVASLGSDVTSVAIGDRVAVMGAGGLAEQVAVSADRLMAINSIIPSEKAVAFLVNYTTTYFALHDRARLQAGETILVHAGAGGVGSSAIQLAIAAGATVIATAGGPDKVQICLRLGADVAIDYTSEDLVQRVREVTDDRGVDVIYDPVGGDIFDQSRRTMAWNGRYLVIGFTSGRIPEAPLNHVLLKNYSIVGVHWGAAVARDPRMPSRVFEKLVGMFDDGKIDPLIFGEPLPLAEAAEAMTKLANRETYGKVVIDPRR
jgi:NADPH2:quinone reductase